MKSSERLIWAVAIVIVDFVVFGVPLAAVFLAYVLVARPLWFKEWVSKIYTD